MDQAVYRSGLARAFYLAIPQDFGKDLQEDLIVFDRICRFVAEGQVRREGRNARPFADAVDEVFLSLHRFFEGSAQIHNDFPVPGYGPRWCKLGHLESGLQGAFKTTCAPDFLALKERFFAVSEGSKEEERRYQLCLERAVCSPNTEVARKAKQEALRMGVDLVLQAHRLHAAESDKRAEVLLADKLIGLMRASGGMRSALLTRRRVAEAFEATAGECNSDRPGAMERNIRSELELKGYRLTD